MNKHPMRSIIVPHSYIDIVKLYPSPFQKDQQLYLFATQKLHEFRCMVGILITLDGIHGLDPDIKELYQRCCERWFADLKERLPREWELCNLCVFGPAPGSPERDAARVQIASTNTITPPQTLRSRMWNQMLDCLLGEAPLTDLKPLILEDRKMWALMDCVVRDCGVGNAFRDNIQWMLIK